MFWLCLGIGWRDVNLIFHITEGMSIDVLWHVVEHYVGIQGNVIELEVCWWHDWVDLANSNCFWGTRLYMSSLLMSQHHFVYVLGGMEIDKVHILMVQPRTVLISSNCPSAMSFFEDMLSTLSISFERTRGRANVRMVRGTAVVYWYCRQYRGRSWCYHQYQHPIYLNHWEGLWQITLSLDEKVCLVLEMMGVVVWKICCQRVMYDPYFCNGSVCCKYQQWYRKCSPTLMDKAHCQRSSLEP